MLRFLPKPQPEWEGGAEPEAEAEGGAAEEALQVAARGRCSSVNLLVKFVGTLD